MNGSTFIPASSACRRRWWYSVSFIHTLMCLGRDLIGCSFLKNVSHRETNYGIGEGMKNTSHGETHFLMPGIDRCVTVGQTDKSAFSFQSENNTAKHYCCLADLHIWSITKSQENLAICIDKNTWQRYNEDAPTKLGSTSWRFSL